MPIILRSQKLYQPLGLLVSALEIKFFNQIKMGKEAAENSENA